MQKRIISALVALLIFIPIIFHGGSIYNFAIYLVGLICLKEFLDAKGHKKPVPFLIRIIAYIFMSSIVLVDVKSTSETFMLDYRILSAMFLAFLIPVILYGKQETYDIKDAFYVLGGVLFLGISTALMIVLRNISLKIVVFIITLAVTTDSFAYITGYLIGKKQILPNLLPKKTWEGLIGGTIMGVFVAALFYKTCINPDFSSGYLIIICTFLSLIAQLGDMAFSAMKRHFGIKDFSNLIPGHGGVLDRMDSIIFIVLGFTFFITIL
ncbi:MAG: CDP-archaeol synthase [Bacilli bacterium]|nr:CDP-archaeol synthase [Bacilli bacterium]